MDGYILYGDHRSGSSTAEMAPVEIGAPFELRPVPLEGDHQLDPEYRRISPMGRVPTLILPDGTVMTESPAILLTLADRHPEAALPPPPGDTGRARALRWMVLAAATRGSRRIARGWTRWPVPWRRGRRRGRCGGSISGRGEGRLGKEFPRPHLFSDPGSASAGAT
ncbi:MAG: glutathione S-transferase family protein [Roseomonas sp.]|nr:glutathione S-transferase family protein [Roseomonas sp.]